jgi:hypothetical protein
MKNEAAKIRGRMTAILHKANGGYQVFERNNLVVEGGIDLLAAALAAPSGRPNVLSHIGVGTGTLAVDSGDTELETELTRKAVTYDHDAGTTSFTLTSTFDPGEGTGDITEAGVFNAASTGTMFNRVVFTAIPKEAGDSLDITFTFTFTPA